MDDTESVLSRSRSGWDFQSVSYAWLKRLRKLHHHRNPDSSAIEIDLVPEPGSGCPTRRILGLAKVGTSRKMERICLLTGRYH